MELEQHILDRPLDGVPEDIHILVELEEHNPADMLPEDRDKEDTHIREEKHTHREEVDRDRRIPDEEDGEKMAGEPEDREKLLDVEDMEKMVGYPEEEEIS
jgi:hypothetical protein